jgi:hypothetical protein
VWHASSLGKTVIHIRLWLGNLRKTDDAERLGVDVKIILKIFKNKMVRCGMDWSGTLIGSSGWLLCICNERTFSSQQNLWSAKLVVSEEILTFVQLVRCMS